MNFTAESCVALHIGDRAEQQDRVRLFAHPRRGGIMMAALADGMGGHSGGAMAAEQVLLRAQQNLADYAPGHESPQRLLADTINEAHTVIRLTRFTSEKDPHSTAVLFLLEHGKAWWAHCGDSRLYHFRGAKPVSRTRDHSLVGELMRKGRLDEAGSLIHPQRNVLLSCLGDTAAPHIEHGSAETLAAGDAFLLCSDGLWAYFTDFELASTIAKQAPREAASTLIRLARERGAGEGDNISLAVIKLV